VTNEALRSLLEIASGHYRSLILRTVSVGIYTFQLFEDYPELKWIKGMYVQH
jgi:hypothetical protein